MPVTCEDPILARLAALRTELVEQACALERQGRLDAADVAIATSARIGSSQVTCMRDYFFASARPLSEARPFAKSPPTILSMLMNRQNTFDT